VVFSFVPQRSAYYRLQFDDGGVTYALADSASVHFGVYPQVPTPSISKASHPYKNKKVGTKYVRINGKRTRVNVYRKVYNKTIYNYRTYGTINPAAAGSGASVVLEFYWRSSSHAKWSSKPVYRRGASTSVSDTLASYSLSTSLRMKHGLWRVRAVFGSRNFSGSVSGYRNFTVK
jgi:hypothetical protein